MQWILFALSYIMLVTAEAGNDQNFGLDAYEHEQRLQHDSGDLYDILDRIEQGIDNSEQKTTNKRALSVLSRWRPFSSLGLRMNSIHKVPSRAPMMSMVPELDFVSAETRGIFRPVGKPLRWGRKR